MSKNVTTGVTIIEDRIFIIRDQQVMIDRDLAELYAVATKVLNQERAEYGKSIIKKLSEALTAKFSRGYSTATLYNFKQFYSTFSDEEIFYKLCRKLNWSHNRLIMRISNAKAGTFYLFYMKTLIVLIFLAVISTLAFGQTTTIRDCSNCFSVAFI